MFHVKLYYFIKRMYQCTRQLSGDDAYDRYLASFANHHHIDEVPLCRKVFFKRREDAKWHNINRCC